MHSPYDRIKDDRELVLGAEITTSLQFYIYNIRSPKCLQSFDFWVKTTCPNLHKLPSTSTMGSQAPTYVSAVSAALIWVDILISFQDGILPCIMLEGSIDRDPDNIITFELVDRLCRHNIYLSPDIFYTSTCIVSNANNSAAVTVKCLMAKETDAVTIQNAFTKLAEKTMSDRYLVTSQYVFESIIYYADDKMDKHLTAAITRQQEFTNLLTETILLGFDNIDPYCNVPSQIMDKVTSELSPNTKSLASLLMNTPTVALDGDLLSSPVLKVATNEERTRIYLTADRQDASQLLSFTADVIPLFKIWMGPSSNITCAVDEARNHASTHSTSGQHQAQSTTTNLTTEATTTTVENTSETTRQVQPTDPPREQVTAPEANTSQMHSSLQSDFRDFRSSVEQRLQALTTAKNNSLSKDDIIETISTVVDSNLNSSLSSMSTTAQTSFSTFMAEQQDTIHSFITNQHEVIQQLNKCIAEGEKTTQELKETLRTYEQTARENTTALTQMTEQNRMLQIAVEASNLHFQQLMAETPQPDRSTRLATWPPQIAATAPPPDPQPPSTSPVSNTPKVGGFSKSFWSSLLPTTAAPTPVKDIPSLPAPEESEIEALNKKAQGVINFLATMPYTEPSYTAASEHHQVEEGEIIFSSPDGETSPAMVATPICHFCNQQDIGLMYCDRCINPEDLYHEHCLTWLRETSERVCPSCLAQPPRQDHPLTQEVPTSSKEPPSNIATTSPTSESQESSTDNSSPSKSVRTTSSLESYSPNPVTKIFSKPNKSNLLSKLKSSKASKPNTAP